MRLVWWLPVLAFARPASAHVPPLPAHYAPLFEQAHSWTYDVATTMYDIEDYRRARPPKKTTHVTVICKVTMVAGFRHAAASRIACDGDTDPMSPIAGDYAATPDGLYRLTRFPKTETELGELLGEQLVEAKPHAYRTQAEHAVHGVREDHHAWCTFDDTSRQPDGMVRSQCFKPNVGIASGDFDGGGENWRRVSYQLKPHH
jgi:hypothetical protein